MHWAFETLDINAEADVASVRRAYARAIKQLDQATEAERFQRIRQAYEWALQWAERRHQVTAAEEGLVDGQNEQPNAHITQTRDTPSGIFVPGKEVHDVWREFMEIYTNGTYADERSLLQTYADDTRLTSLDGKASFEIAVLGLALGSPPEIVLLDAGCDLFSWETAHRHFSETHPDFIPRLQRHQLLRRFLQQRRDTDLRDLIDAVRIHALCLQSADARPELWKIRHMNKLFDRYAAYKRELGERFGVDMLDWWQSLLEHASWAHAHTAQTIQTENQAYIEWKIQRSLPSGVEIIAPAKKEFKVPEIDVSPPGEIQVGRGVMRTLREIVQWIKAIFFLGVIVLFLIVITLLLTKK
jgi:hypothetical protein